MKSFTLEFLGAAQGILLSLFFLFKAKRHLANLMMGLYLLFFSLGLLERWVDGFHSSISSIGQIIIGDSSFLYGPFLYLFVYFLVTNQPRFERRQLRHFAPFIIVLGGDLISFSLRIDKSQFPGNIGELIAFELFVIQILWYNLASIKMLKRHHKLILETYSNIEERDLLWLERLLIVITAIYILSFSLSQLDIFRINFLDRYFIIVQMAIVLCIYVMSYRVLFSPGMFAIGSFQYLPEQRSPAIHDEEPPKTAATVVKYKKSGLKPEQVQTYIATLSEFMEKQKPYTNPDLNIFLLAQTIGISKNYLTQLLNEHLHVSFYEFINSYRIGEAQRLLKDPENSNLTMAGIASNAGFKSRTTFFTNFKKTTGFTPQEWVQNNQRSSQ